MSSKKYIVCMARINNALVEYDFCQTAGNSDHRQGVPTEYLGDGIVWSVNGVLQNSETKLSFFNHQKGKVRMSKKYRLEINYSEITEDNFEIVSVIREPMTMNEAWNECEGSFEPNLLRAPPCWFQSGWNSCLENQKLGVADEESDHLAMINYSKTLQPGQRGSIRLIWNAALKYARGLS